MKNTINKKNLALAVFLTGMSLAGLYAGSAQAQVPTGDITQLYPLFATELERRAAVAAFDTYNELIAAGCVDTDVFEPKVGPCTGQTFILFNNLRGLIHTADEIVNGPPLVGGNAPFSLGLDLQGLGFALRWTAGEEYAALGSLSGDYSRGQISGLAARLGALRMGARGFSIAAMPAGMPESVAYGDRPLSGGAAGADDGYSRWGGFINYAYGSGKKDPTGLEDAFDFDGGAINVGVDYRINDRWVAGVMGGLYDQAIDFDSNQSVVSGGVNSDGISVMPFVGFQDENFYASGSISYQQLSFDTRRDIIYPSLNILIPPIETTTVSDTDATIFSYFGEIGYSWRWDQFSIDPYVNLELSSIDIDGFVENDLNNDAFDLAVKGQSVDSTEITAGVKFQYVLTPSYGVFIPFLNAELVNQRETDPNVIDARYASALSNQSSFRVPSDDLDSGYNVFTLGVSAVLRGSRQGEADDVVAGGLQGFFQYKVISGLDNYDINGWAVGLRYEF